jgi:hypothetical protein
LLNNEAKQNREGDDSTNKKQTMNWDGRVLGMIQRNRERNDGPKNEHLALSWDGRVLGTK